MDNPIDVEAYRFRVAEERRQLLEDCAWSSVGALKARAFEYRRDHGIDIWPALEEEMNKIGR